MIKKTDRNSKIGNKKITLKSEIDYIELMDHVFDDNIDILDKLDPQENKSAPKKSKEILFEDIKFKKEGQAGDFEHFIKTLFSFLHDDDVSEIEYLKNQFETNKLDKKKLFAEFEKILGKDDVFKYFYQFSRTFSDEKKSEQLYEMLQSSLKKLRFRQKNVLFGLHTYQDFFHKINDEISANIIEKINSKNLNLKKKYQINRERLFQLIGALKALDVIDLFKFKYVNNFLFSVDSKPILQRSLFVFNTKFQYMLNKISNIDILILSFYFNFGLSKFEADISGVDANKINPNLLKVFLRHYPKFADELKYDVQSDKEDYEVKDFVHDNKIVSTKNNNFKDNKDQKINDKKINTVLE